MPASSSLSQRRRGAPPGNQNALKHSLYAAQTPAFPPPEAGPLAIDLQTEIALIRRSIQRVLTLGDPQTYHEAVDYLRALSLAATALTRLVRTHRYLHPAPNPHDELTNTINEALREIGAQIEAGTFPSSRPRRLPRPRPPRRFHRPASRSNPMPEP